MDVTNAFTAPLGLPSGRVLPARSTTSVPDDEWSQVKGHIVVADWLKTGRLRVGAVSLDGDVGPSHEDLMAAWREKQARDAEAARAKGDQQQGDGQKANAPDLASLSDDELRTYLADRGVKADGRWARDRLLSEAEKVKG